MSLSRRSLLGLAAAAPVAAVAAGPSGFSAWLGSLLRRPAGALGLGRAFAGHTIIEGGSIQTNWTRAGRITAGQISVGSIRADKLTPGSMSLDLNPLSVRRAYRGYITTSVKVRETQGEHGRVLEWGKGFVDVNPDRSWHGEELPGFSGLYAIEAGRREVRNADRMALILEEDEAGSLLRAVTPDEVPDLKGHCVVSTWTGGIMGSEPEISNRFTSTWPEPQRLSDLTPRSLIAA